MAGLRYYACVAAFFRCAGTLAQAASGAIRETQAVFEDLLKGMPDDKAQLVTHGNAERVFNWKMAD